MKTETWESKGGHKIGVTIPDEVKSSPLFDHRVNYHRVDIHDCPRCKFVKDFLDKNYDWVCTKNEYFTPVGEGYTCDLWEG
jgi:hypothetical protein